MENVSGHITIPRGWSYEKASMMGMPDVLVGHCVNCFEEYDKMGFRSKHHLVPKGMGGKDRVMTIKSKSNGLEYKVRSPLMSLCGSGTTGCHSLFHGRAKLYAEWVFVDEEAERLWFDGHYLDAGIKPNSDQLFSIGHYVINERQGVVIPSLWLPKYEIHEKGRREIEYGR